MEQPRAPRALTEDESRACLSALLRHDVASEDVCERAVEVARIHLRAPRLVEIRGLTGAMAHVALGARSRAAGVALHTDVYVREDLVGADGALPRSLVVHEVTHVAQALRDGWPTFLARYARAYLAGRARGLDDYRAYLAIPYEVEARRVAVL